MPHPFVDFYRGKRVLVTGHTGFTGGWLVAWLKLLGAKVFGYGLPPATRPNLFDANLLDRGITSMFGDVRDRNALANAFAEFQPEIVIHYAAQSLEQRSQRDPVETFATNVMGTVHVLEEARLTSSVRALVVVSGDQCYENRDWFWGFSRDEDSRSHRARWKRHRRRRLGPRSTDTRHCSRHHSRATGRDSRRLCGAALISRA